MKLGNKRKATSGSEPVKKKKAKTVIVENDGKVVQPKIDQDMISQKFKSMIKALTRVSKDKNEKNDDEDIHNKSSESAALGNIESTMDEKLLTSVTEKDENDIDEEDDIADFVVGGVFHHNERDLLETDLKSDLQKMENIVKEALKEKDKAIKREKQKNKKLEISLKELETVRKDLKRTIDVLSLVQKKNEELEEAVESKNKVIEKLILTNKDKDSNIKIGESDESTVVMPNKVNLSTKKKMRFKLLLEARNKFFINIRIEQMVDEHLHQLLKSPDGSIFFQENCHLATECEKDILFKIVHYNPASMANNKFGSFIFMDFLQVFSEQQKKELFKKMAPSFKPVLLNCYGSRVLQDTFGLMPKDVQSILITVLSKDVIDYSKNIFASFVLQKVIELGNVDESLKLKMIMLKIQEEAQFLSTDKFGSRVVQKVLIFAPEEVKKNLKSLIYEMLPNLIDHKYGNYIAQRLVEFGTELDRRKVVSCCSGNIVEMATSKYASNVIQWILKAGSVEDKIQVIKELSGKKELENLVRNQYGNYVVQHIIDNAEVCFLREIHDKILAVVDANKDLGDLAWRKLMMMVEDKFSKKNIVRLAKRFDKDDELANRLALKFKKFYKEIERWMGDILSFEKMKIDNLMIPLFIEVLEEINDNEENCDLADLRQSLRDYLKDVVAYKGKQDYGCLPATNPQHEEPHERSSAYRHGYQVSQNYPPHHPEQVNQHPQLNQHVLLPGQDYPPHHAAFVPHRPVQQQVYLAQPYPGSITYQNIQHSPQVGNNLQSNTSNYVNMATLPSSIQHPPSHFFIPQHSQVPPQQHAVNQYQNHLNSSFQQGSHHQSRHY